MKIRFPSNNLLRCAIAGAVFVPLLLGVTTGALFIIERTGLTDGILVLATGLLAALAAIGAGLVAAVGGAFLVLGKRVKNKALTLGGGALLATEAWLAIHFALLVTNWFVKAALATLASALLFMVCGWLLTRRIVVGAVAISLLVIGSGYMVVIQYQQGNERAQVNALKAAGYAIYMPPPASGLTIKHIESLDRTYTGYKEGVSVEFVETDDDIQSLFEYRRPGYLPTAECGTDYLKQAAAADENSCTLVAETNNMSVYKRESKSFVSDGQTYVYQEYFAVAGETLILVNDLGYSYQTDAAHKIINPGEKENLQRAKTFLLSLVPVQPWQLPEFIIKR